MKTEPIETLELFYHCGSKDGYWEAKDEDGRFNCIYMCEEHARKVFNLPQNLPKLIVNFYLTRQPQTYYCLPLIYKNCDVFIDDIMIMTEFKNWPPWGSITHSWLRNLFANNNYPDRIWTVLSWPNQQPPPSGGIYAGVESTPDTPELSPPANPLAVGSDSVSR